jgi:hypothetical protein|tara:strand:+ start:443 stop:826 length:384 start_codon:yes stop_codon:yes gene_type:complete
MGKEDRLKRRIKKKEDKIKSLTPKAGNNKPKGRAVTPTFSVVNKSAVKGNTGRTKVDGCGSAAQQRGSKNCSKSATGKKFSTKGTTKTAGTLQKRKRIQKKVDNLKDKLSKSKKGSPTKKHANPRYL